ncbi:hypothetical protein A0256_15445 [Mucilaginibacter sp. PAMC 26640]|nr:hypothetical protein A0256_15445 [Mucilaginibacter sp. PAMC 26640]
MIYLIDDNRREQQKEYGCDFLTDTDLLSFFKIVSKIIVGTDITYLKDSTCILIHNSFPDFNASGEAISAQTNIYESILTLAGEKTIPVVIFTNSILDLDYNKSEAVNISRINKRLFYSNLKDFLYHFKETGNAEFKILTYGKSFIAQDLSLISAQISSLINSYSFKDKLPKIKELTAQFATLAKSEMAVMAKFEAAAHSSAPGVLLNYLEKIIQSILRHGRNIYS